MKLSTTISFNGDPVRLAQQARDLESAGIDLIWGGEIYGFDLTSTLAYLAGQTERVHLMTGIIPVYSRSPTLIAQTAATIDALSGGRFVLGLGTSGPQVIEGWHGVPFDKPMARTRDTIEICRKVWSGEKVSHDGKAYSLPLPEGRGTGLGKPLKFMNKMLRPDIPIVVASIGPKNVELTAELANGWQPIHFVPDRFQQVWGESLAAGKAKRSADMPPLEIIAGGPVALGDGPAVTEAREAARGNIAFYVGGMGAKSKNFYNDLFKRYGWEEEAEKIQDLFLSGHRAEATAAVPDEYLDLSTLCGPEGQVRERLEIYAEVGVTHLNITPQGEDKLGTIEKIKAWVE
ncbi:MAG: LLM class F420-dependent oxidoreductase [Actinomycetia bacterium]|nr:LLM class F420-dependent oxidoreductase [Actinomycetes bacterium]MCP5030623.1 LLM class F420-dependent oxidoreductase [Actinomycetes bacterium]